MRLKWKMVLSLGLLLTLSFGQVTLAQEPNLARIIPITSKGFNTKLSPDGKTLVTFENPYVYNLKQVNPLLLAMRVIDMGEHKLVGSLSEFTDYVSDVAFTTDSRRMVSLHQNGDVVIWDMVKLKPLQTFQTLMMKGIAIELLKDNRTAFIEYSDSVPLIAIFDIQTGIVTGLMGKHFDSFMEYESKYSDYPNRYDIAFLRTVYSPNQTMIARASASSEVILWSTENKDVTVVRKKSDVPGDFQIGSMIFTPDNKALLYVDYKDQRLHIWDIETGVEEKTIAVVPQYLLSSPQGVLLGFLSREKQKPETFSIAPLDRPEHKTVLLTLENYLTMDTGVTRVTVTPDGKQIVVGGFFAPFPRENQIYVIDLPADE